MRFAVCLEWIFRLVLAGAFLKAGYEKARDPIQFLFDIRSFHLLPDPWAALLALGLPWLELFCAAGVLVKKLRLYAGSVAVLAGSLAVFIAAIAWSWHRGLDVSCGCFGKTDFTMTYTQHLLLNTTLLGMALWLLWREKRVSRSSGPASGFPVVEASPVTG